MKSPIYPVIVCFLAGVCTLALAACSEEDNPHSPNGDDTAGYYFFTYKTVNVFPHNGTAFTQGLVYVDGFLIDGNATAVCWDQEGVHLRQPAGAASGQTTLDEKMMAIVDPDSGETQAHPDMPDATDPVLVERIASEMDGELLEVLHRPSL